MNKCILDAFSVNVCGFTNALTRGGQEVIYLATIEQLREENALLEKNIRLMDELKKKRSNLGVHSKVNETFDGSQSPENYRAHLTRYMQNKGFPFKGRSYLELLSAIQEGEFRQ